MKKYDFGEVVRNTGIYVIDELSNDQRHNLELMLDGCRRPLNTHDEVYALSLGFRKYEDGDLVKDQKIRTIFIFDSMMDLMVFLSQLYIPEEELDYDIYVCGEKKIYHLMQKMMDAPNKDVEVISPDNIKFYGSEDRILQMLVREEVIVCVV